MVTATSCAPSWKRDSRSHGTEWRTGETALHAAAGSRARPAIRVLVQHWPDFLIRDRQGRLASELAYLYGEDPAMAHLLGIRERKNAIATGRDVRRRNYRGL